jgi:hypothetical protein
MWSLADDQICITLVDHPVIDGHHPASHFPTPYTREPIILFCKASTLIMFINYGFVGLFFIKVFFQTVRLPYCTTLQ